MRLVEIELTDHLSRVCGELMSAKAGQSREVVRIALAPAKAVSFLAEYPKTAEIKMEVAEIWTAPMMMLPPWLERSDTLNDLVELYRIGICGSEFWYCPSLCRIYRAVV